MPEQCCNGACKRKSPIRVQLSGLTGRAYAITRYKNLGRGSIAASEKHDVTRDVAAFMADAWSRGWDDCADSKPGDVVPNPYTEQETSA